MKKMVIEERKDKSQASPSGVDWATAVKSFLLALGGPGCEKKDVIELMHSVVKGESEFKNYQPSHDTFYSCLASLGIHFVAANATLLSYENINVVKEGCRILLRHLLKKLNEQSESKGNVSPNLTVKQLILPLANVCGVENGGLPASDLAVLVSMIKSAELPLTGDKSGQPQTLSTISSTGSISSQDKKPSSDSSQKRAEPLIEQLTSALLVSHGTLWTSQSRLLTGTAKESTDAGQADQTVPDGQKVKKILNAECCQLLVLLRGSRTLLELSYSLPGLERYLSRWYSCKESMTAPTFNADAGQLSFLVTEINVSQTALSLPIYEPLTEEKVGLVSDLSAAWLLCAVTQASIHPKDEESERQIATLVEGALSFFNTAGDFLKNSTRAGGYVYQNHLTIGGWILLSGLHHALAGLPGVPPPGPAQSLAHGRSPAKSLSRPNLNKIQQGGVGAVWVALGWRCVRVCGAVLRDARLEACGGFAPGPGGPGGPPVAPAPLHVLNPGSAGERAMTLLQCAPLHQLFVTLGVVSYRKATTLKRAVAQKQYQADPDADQSDSTIYYQDMILCSEDSETDDEDSEPLLGLWFESTLVAPDANDSTATNTTNVANSANETKTDNQETDDNTRGIDDHTVVPDKAEPYAYIALASDVFEILCEEVACVIEGVPGVEVNTTYLNSTSLQLQDAQTALLAALIRDLDRETAWTDTGTISSCFGPRLGTLYGTFSASLGRYLHILSTSSVMQTMLLQHLGIGSLPGDKTLDKPGTYPLQLGVRVLKLIGSIVLSKPLLERENVIMGIWSRIVNTITDCALQWSPPSDHDFEDLNVEHAQLLLYMFHSLNLMNKKVVLLLTANAICKVSDSLCFSDRGRASQLPPHQLMLTARLLLFLEYFMRHLYDAPPALMQQIEWNLLVAPGLTRPWNSETPETSESANSAPSRIFWSVPEIEKDYKRMVPDEWSMRPKFYALTNTECNPGEVAKLDGLACNFVLGTDKLRYTALMDSLLSLLNTVTVCDASAAASPQQLCAARYCFQISWRLMCTMPPPKSFMDRIATGRMASLPCPLPLHTALWGPRSTNGRPYFTWLKEILTKQGVFTPMAENLLKEVSDICDNISYCAWLAERAIHQLMDNLRPGCMPSLLDIISTDCILSRLRSALAEKEPGPAPSAPPAPAGPQPPATPGAPGGPAPAPALLAPADPSQLSAQFLLSLLSLVEIVFECCRVSAAAEIGWEAESEAEARPAELLEARLRLSAAHDGASGAAAARGAAGPALQALGLALRLRPPPSRTRRALPDDEIPSEKREQSSNAQCRYPSAVRSRSAVRRSGGAAEAEERQAAPVRRLFGEAAAAASASDADAADADADAPRDSDADAAPRTADARRRSDDADRPALGGERALLGCGRRQAGALGAGGAAALRLLAQSAAGALALAAPALAHGQPGAGALRDRALNALVPALLDARLECVAEPCATAITILQSSSKGTEQLIHETVFKITYPMLVEQLSPSTEKILSAMVTYWQAALERQAGKLAMVEMFGANTDLPLSEVLLKIPLASPTYGAQVVKLFNSLMTEVCNESWGDRSLCIEFCNSIGYTRPDRLVGLLYEICNRAGGTATALASSPSEGELATPTGPIPNQSVQVPQPSSTNSSPAPNNGQSETVQQSSSDSSTKDKEKEKEKDKESTGAANTPAEPFDSTNHCTLLLSNLIYHMQCHCDKVTIHAMLSCLVSLAEDTMRPLPALLGPRPAARPALPLALPHALRQMAALADAHLGSGHAILFPAAVDWLNVAMDILSKENTLEQVEWGYVNNGQPSCVFSALLEVACVLLTYITDALQVVASGSTVSQANQPVYRSISPSWETPADFSAELDWPDEMQDEDDTSADDSDEDSMLNMRLCTFTVTAREFMNQHWYHCHTCGMVDGVGVCSVCARVCHRGHDVTYAKFGNFFCDCGAKEDSSCQALVKRNASAAVNAGRAAELRLAELAGAAPAPEAGAEEPARPASPPGPAHPSRRAPAVARALPRVRPMLQSFAGWSRCVERIALLAAALVPSLKAECARRSPVGCAARARRALACLLAHCDRKYLHTDALMVPTLGSQEGAFENVRMSYTGEQGQTIRQLIGAHMIRRVAMCCLASPLGRRQHLAVSHEKGKITVLQLSALLKQADSPKHKLTLTRLSSAPIPFTVLTLSGNAWNEDLLAVCGLKDCHVLTFNSGGSVAEHIALQPGLDTGNFIIRAIWLPGTQTQLALITADFVKIYDLSKDTISPQYHFLVPSGKVRDVTFVYHDEVMHMLCMGSAGHIYWQPMSEESRASHGPFYVTNTLEVIHPEIKDVAGQVGGGGVSIYYSHIMKMLFFSYAQGKSFMAPLPTIEENLQNVSMITLSSSGKESAAAGAGAGAGGGAGAAPGAGRGAGKGCQALCEWAEVPGHPGLLAAAAQASNNPVLLMLRPFQIGVQEIKVTPAKAKITDMVAVRHATNQHGTGEHKTTLILLCEDGSLRIYAANPENTGFWLSSSMQPVWKSASGSSTTNTAGVKSRKAIKAASSQATAKGKAPQSAAKPTSINGAPQFPIDFFEHCLVLGDVEFGGNDLLQVYNRAQVKHRLNTTGLYVASTKLSGFALEIVNPDPCTVITGIRFLLGTQDTNRSPTYIEIFGRTIPTGLQHQRSRWFDIPLTRDESLQIDKKLTVTFGPSQDAEGVVMVDSVKVYGRTKESFGWPDESEEGAGTSGKAGGASGSATAAAGGSSGSGGEEGSAALERLACAALEALELGVSEDLAAICESNLARDSALEAAQKVLCAPCTPNLHAKAKHLMHAVHGQSNYHYFKDRAIMAHVLETLRELAECEERDNIDPENFFRCTLLTRTIAVERPANLVKFGGTTPAAPEDGDWSSLWNPSDGPIAHHVVCLLAGVTWRLAHVVGPWPEGAGSAGPMPIVAYGLRHVEHTLHALVDVIHAYQLHSPDPQMVNIGNSIYCTFLLAKDQNISFGTKTAIMRVLRPKVKRRRVYIPSPPTTPVCGTSTASTMEGSIVPVPRNDDLPPPDHNDNRFVEVDHPLEPMVLLAREGGLEALLDIPADADDETMVELAIALSLQEGEGEGGEEGRGGAGRAPGRGPGRARGLGRGVRGAPPPEAPAPPPHRRNSPPGSDDEGSGGGEAEGGPGDEGADGAGRPQPAEPPEPPEAPEPPEGAEAAADDAAGSDSGGSGADSIGGVSGRSSAYGGSQAGPEGGARGVRVALLDAALAALPRLRDASGARAVPFLQVMLMLAGDLDISSDQDRSALDRLLDALVAELEMDAPQTSEESSAAQTPIYERTNRRELQLVITRLLSVLMARWKPPTTSTSAASGSNSACAQLSRVTAIRLAKGHAVPHCAHALSGLLFHWRSQPAVPATSTSSPAAALPPTPGSGQGPAALGEQLLRPHPPHPLPDMQPFFVKQYVKSHPWDVFENYPHLLTEMALRLPYQIHKLLNQQELAQYFDKSWNTLLCEYMMNQQTPFLRKQVRKLLMLLCGGREKYRQLRDTHALNVHLSEARVLCSAFGLTFPSQPRYAGPSEEPSIGTDLPYDSLVKLMDHLKASAEMAVQRTGNWQYMCSTSSPTYLSWLVRAACIVGEGVAPALLQLVQCALCAPVPAAPTVAQATATLQQQKERNDRERSADSDSSATDGSRFQESLVPQLVRQIWDQLSRDELKNFIRVFLLETNSTAVRWQAHALLLSIYNNCTDAERSALVALLWGIWPTVPQYGRKAGQFVDLLGYFSLKTTDIKTEEYLASAVELLRTQNNLLAGHGNAPLYAALANYVELDGHYLESEPCLVCNNPEVPMSTIKLSTIKIDSKFTTTTQIVKLIGSHMISRISLRISDLKRSKMVRAMNFFYNNRTVQAVQELKNKPGLWHKAKRVYLQSGQTEVRVDFPLPIVACNLMMEYADFYENQQATGESLQCPRCSASVPANPGVCANCGENVFQCHKCRAINYDEKDPFLCHACGFCKYAKFDYTLTARQCCAVDTIENDDDRKKMMATIGTLLDKADRVYRQLVANKPVLESLVHKISEQRVEGRGGAEEGGLGGAGTGTGASAAVNRSIQTLAHKYCLESRGHFDDLSKIIQKVLACRKELVAYDRSQSEQHEGDIPPAYTALLHGSVTDPGKSTENSRCYGCALAAAEYCLTLLRALASAPKHREKLCQLGLVKELVHHNLRRGSSQCQEEVRQLVCLVTRDNLPATEALCNLLSQRITLSLMGHAATQDHSNAVRPLVVLLGALVKMEDAVECWEARLRCIVRLWMWCCPHLAEAAGVTPNQVTLALLENNTSTLSIVNDAGTTTCNAAQQHALQQVALPCLRFMRELMAPAGSPSPGGAAAAGAAAAPGGAAAVPPPVTLDQAKESSAEKSAAEAPVRQSLAAAAAETAVLDLGAWLEGRVPFAHWRKLAPDAADAPPAPPAPAPPGPPAPAPRDPSPAPRGPRDRMPPWAGPLGVRDRFLAEKYACKWNRKVLYSHGMRPLNLAGGSWLRPVIFDASSKRSRDTACQLTKELCHGYERTKAVIILLTGFLPEVGAAGEASEQFLQLYQSLISEAPWKQFLALRGVLQQLADLMTKEIEHLHRLEETTLTSDLSQGYALKRLTELLALLLEEPGTRRTFKGRLVGAVLGGYLSLRRLVVQRTRLTDDTQEKLLELLEEMTTGTEAETAEFMAVCIETVQKYPLHDYRTPVFIFERLCSIIYPEDNDVGEFFLTLEKDPQQEDFLQGRMLGNPYSSMEAGLGPLMRDVKNKICADCELVALLEDDNGMELLVCNKIMSLDLPVKDVYKKVWCAGGEGGDAMRVVYRMRGLLGDATEEFVESLTGNAGGNATDADGADDDETTYRLAGALADCGGIECMLARLRGVRRVASARALCAVLLRLAGLCARVRRCLRVLTRCDAQAVPALLRALQLAVDDERDRARPDLTCQLLEIMERILSVAASESLESFLHFSLTFGGPEYVHALFSCTECPGIRNNPTALGHLTRVLAALVYGNDLKMALLCAHFANVLDFNKFDSERKAEDQFQHDFRLELFCVLCANIERNAIGGTLKDYLISLGIVRDALDYITVNAPCVKPTLLRTDSDELKEFISRPALKYILRFLTGLATEHEATQMAVCEKVIPIVHRLEQVSSDEHVGSLAENLLEALRSHPEAAKKVQESRDYTRQEKKRLAMAMREKQLGALGMRTNEKGQVTAAQCSLVHQVQELGEETGLVCCICREGYKYQPTKVLGIYTFTKRCGVDEFEARVRKTLGYTTVSHFNVVHVECHMAAVRLARARDEWESAALQNASTRCNGLLPLWGPHVPESAFASCLARHNTYLQECTSHRDIGYQLTVHDVKLLLLRFARARTFHDDTGGGGPLSNMQLVPALMHLALYVINTTRTASREVSALTAAMEWSPARRLEACHDAEGPLYHATMALLIQPPDKWRSNRVEYIRRMILLGHCRALSPKGPALRALAEDQRTPFRWDTYKPYMVFFAEIQMLYDIMFKHVTATSVEQWPVKLAEAIRHGDEAGQRCAERMLAAMADELLPSSSFEEFCDAAGLLSDIEQPQDFIQALLNEQPD